MPSTSCCVYGCLNTTVTAGHLTFFSLPSNSERRAIWLQLIAREELQNKDPHNYTICSVHFKPEDITQGRIRTMLRRNMIPTLHLPPGSADLIPEILKKLTPQNKETTTQELPQQNVSAPELPLQVLPAQQSPPEVLTPQQLPPKKLPRLQVQVKKTQCTTNMVYVSSKECQTEIPFRWMPLRERQYAADSLTHIDIKKEHGVDDTDEMQTFHNLCDRFLTREIADLAKLQAVLNKRKK